jgi:inorganic pyrophosphatase
MKLHTLDPRTEEGLTAVIETPRGSRHKYAYDKQVGAFRLSRSLPSGEVFPFDFGFIPSTLAPDGDPLDVLVVIEDPTFPGCLIDVHLIGVIEAEQTEGRKKERNDRLIAVAATSHRHGQASALPDIGKPLIDEITEFFVDYNKQQGKTFKPRGRYGRKRAEALFQKAHRQYLKNPAE